MKVHLSRAAAHELMRQSAVAGIPGEMFAEIVGGGCSDHTIIFKPGKNLGTAIAREAGVTVYAQSSQLSQFNGIRIGYREDLSGGGFYFVGQNIRVNPCGNCFEFTR